MSKHDRYSAAAQIVYDAGGELVGRTRLQKIAYLLQLAGYEDVFSFEYRHYGPYSEDLAASMEIAALLGPVEEEERRTDWGGRYSIYSVKDKSVDRDLEREAFVMTAKKFDAIDLELAATSAYLFVAEGIGQNGNGNPWAETARRKPSKAADGRLERAFEAYEILRNMNTRIPLPLLPNP